MSFLPYALMAVMSGAAGYWNPIPQPGEPGYEAQASHNFRVLFENDSAFGTDCDYTHGTRLDYAQQIHGSKNWWGVSLTQNIYTPKTNTNHNVQGQHPYAGYLAVGAAYMMPGKDVGASFEFQLGTTGKASLAREAQWFVHKMGDMTQWHGWGDQMRGEVTFQLSMRQDFRLPWLECELGKGWQTDGSLYLREEVGTVSILGGAGATFRVGCNLPPAAQLQGITPANYGVSVLETPRYNPEALSYYLVLSAGMNYVARDMFIDGGVFHDFDRTCGRMPWQFEGRVGFAVRYENIDYYVGAMMNSGTHRSQPQPHVVGSFAVGWNW